MLHLGVKCVYVTASKLLIEYRTFKNRFKAFDMSKPGLVSIVIPNWNGRHFLTSCLDSLLAQTYKDFEIIVVDNGSKDGSLDLLNEEYPQVKLIALDHNTGFSFAVNRGIEASDGEFIALINNDTKGRTKLAGKYGFCIARAL